VQFNATTYTEYFRNDPMVKNEVKGMAANIVEIIMPDDESLKKGKLVPVEELIRKK
jgi:hypothetical protein